MIDGACVLVAYKNAGGNLNLNETLTTLMEEALKMPGAMCAKWGVCGAVTSVGAALAIIDKTGPLSTNDWGEHMKLTSKLRRQEDFWGWEIDEQYICDVENSFQNNSFKNSLSLLAYEDEKVVGRIDSSLICSHFDGSTKAYLDWICVLKNTRHKGVAQALMAALRKELKGRYNANTLIGLIAGNPEAQNFYRSLENAKIRDEGIWIDL